MARGEDCGGHARCVSKVTENERAVHEALPVRTYKQPRSSCLSRTLVDTKATHSFR
jgi:hypothetical protein